MDDLILLAFVVLGAVLIMPVIALVIASQARKQSESLAEELRTLRAEQKHSIENEARLLWRIEALERREHEEKTAEPPMEMPKQPAQPLVLRDLIEEATAKTSVPPKHEPPPLPTDTAPALPTLPLETPSTPATPSLSPQHTAEPPPIPATASAPEPRHPTPPPRQITLEQFMGAKLFAWVGGLALFLGIIFFVKLSIERGWISPELRTAMGFVVGVGLVAGGVVMRRQVRYLTLAHTLSATGIVILYGVTFAAHSLWRIPPLDHSLVAFGVMALITAAAFLLAVRMDAQVVAVLGMLGGFLTPILCSTGRDQPLGLFVYIALLDIGVLAVAKHKRWLHLTTLAAAATILMQGGWMAKFFHPSAYEFGPATWIPVAVFLGFAALFTAAAWWSRRREDEDAHPSIAALALCASAMVAACVFLFFSGITVRPVLLYTFVLGINAAAMAVLWLEPRTRRLQGVLASVTFIHLAVWTTNELTTALLPYALGIYLVFGLLHTAFAVVMERRAPQQAAFTSWVPIVTLGLMLLPVLCLDVMSLSVWPVILIVDLLVIVIAAITARLLPVIIALVLTLVAAGAWLIQWPGEAALSLLPFLLVVGGFAIVFGVAGSYLARKLPKAEGAQALPVSAAVLPFLLLVMATMMLRIPDPSSIFGLALLLVLFLLALVRISGITALAPAALGCTLALEWAWHQASFSAESAVTPLLWHAVFYLLFTAFPFVFQKQFATRPLPWITAAAAGVGSFSLVYRVVMQAWPNDSMGLLPIAFAIAPLASLAFVLKKHSATNPARLTQLAWFGGVALFFITLVFPIQFERQWITLGWALEGAALCWLFRRVPHPGLRGVGTGLLVAAFVRLALNPAVLEYQTRGETAILNWQLYAYSLTALALFMAAKWLTPPTHLWQNFNLRGLFGTLGGILLFLLLNIEIANAFTPAGSRSIAFDFDGNLARDMTYTIAWALFALTLLALGIWRRNPPTRYAGIGLLALALLKLFLHDLANIDSGYRIGALIGVAIIALIASFLYQRFLTEEKP